MKKIFGVTIIVVMSMLALPSSYSFTPEKGFYAEYEMYKDPRDPHPGIFALLREHHEWYIKFLYLEDMVYKYQILDVKDNTAYIRMCFEGTANAEGYNIASHKEVAFKRIFDITVNLNTLEMIDKNGNAWGKWLFWIPLGSYDRKEYTVMKNWNDHGKVKGWLRGPLEHENLSSILASPYAKNLTHYFFLTTIKRDGNIFTYPLFEDYGIMPSYNVQLTEEGTVSGKSGSYYIGSHTFGTSEGEKIEGEPGMINEYYYTDEGILLEADRDYMDDFVDQKLGIVVLQLSWSLILTDYGVKDEIVIEDPKPENQRTSFLEEVRILEGKSSEDVPQETKAPEPPQEKSETPSPTTTQPQEDTENNTMLYYVVPLLLVMIVAVFIVLREKR